MSFGGPAANVSSGNDFVIFEISCFKKKASSAGTLLCMDMRYLSELNCFPVAVRNKLRRLPAVTRDAMRPSSTWKTCLMKQSNNLIKRITILQLPRAPLHSPIRLRRDLLLRFPLTLCQIHPVPKLLHLLVDAPGSRF